ncbi:MAG: 4Fe-4S binding protein [Synergistaceae bacterium]|nr:4Fe-4S binding protein [Synergistaceae bacterium]
MLNRMALLLLKQAREKFFTNPFPVKAMPDSLTDALKAAEEGEIELNPPVEINERFRGKLDYDRTTCIGCRLCIKVCPAHAIEFLPEDKKIQIHNDRCCFCAQCTEICPVKCLKMSPDFLISSYDRQAQITTDSGNFAAKKEA